MESLKPMLLLVVLGGVGYGVYVALNQAPPPEPPARVAPDWKKPLPQAAAPRGMSAQPSAPGFNASAPPSKTDSPLARSNSLPFGIDNAPRAQAAGAPAPVQTAAAPPPVYPPRTESVPPVALPENQPLASQPERSPLPPAGAATAEAEQARGEFAASMRYGQSLLAGGKLVEALRELSKWYDHPALSPTDQNQLVETLGQLAGTVIYSRDPWLGPPYLVQPGDTLESIAQQCQVPWQLLAKVNGIANPQQLAPGQPLKVIRGPFYAQLNLQQQWLALFVDGMYAGRFRVEGNVNAAKPNGTYPVAKFAADLPSNVARRQYVSLGGDLHLCVPDDAGTPGVSAVRIAQRDMEDVFDMLSERSQVTVRR